MAIPDRASVRITEPPLLDAATLAVEPSEPKTLACPHDAELCGGMLNPISRICFALAAVLLVLAAVRWFKASESDDEALPRLLRRAAWPTSYAMMALAIGIAAMMAFGPWSKPYQANAALDSMFKRDPQEVGGAL